VGAWGRAEDPARRVLVVDDNRKLVTVISQSRMLHLVSGVLDSLPDPAHRTLQERNLHQKEVRAPSPFTLARLGHTSSDVGPWLRWCASG